MSITDSIISFLKKNNIEFKLLSHEPTPTSELAAKARGNPLSQSAKAIIMKVDESFKMFVFRANTKINSKKIKKYFKTKKLRFASKEELLELTGLVPGSIPPFGRPLLPIELFIDDLITKNDRVYFNAGSLTASITLKASDYLKVTKPIIFSFAKVF